MMAVDPFNKSAPGFDRHLGFTPCRDEDCDRDDVHPVHDVAARRGPKLRQPTGVSAETERELRARLRAEIEAEEARKRARNRARVKELAVVLDDPAFVRRQQARREEWARAKLAANGIAPSHVWYKEDGSIFAEEWRCPTCAGRGFQSNPSHVCYRCRGRMTVTCTPSDILVVLVKQGAVK